MIRYLQRDDIDDNSWNACLEASFNGNIYGRSWFLDIVAENWGALVEEDYERVFPVVYKKKFGIAYIYQPFFTQQLGLYSKTILSQEVVTRFIEAIPAGFRVAETNLNTHNHVDQRKYRAIPQLNHEIDLIESYENIRKGYSDNLKRNIRKAEEQGLSIVKNIRPEIIIDIFRKSRGREFRHLREASYLRLKRLAYVAMHKGVADIWGVINDRNDFCAGAFFFHGNRKAVFLFSGLSAEGREKGAMPFLIDSFIREHSNRHMTFDFDGSNDPNLARFYKSFGAGECHYQRLYFDHLGPVTQSAVNFVRHLRKRLH